MEALAGEAGARERGTDREAGGEHGDGGASAADSECGAALPGGGADGDAE